MPEITKGQIEQAREIDRLMKKVYGLDYWKPKRGDWIYEDDVKNPLPELVDAAWLVRETLKLKGAWRAPPGVFPLLTWSDCRVLLEEMEWRLSQHIETSLSFGPVFLVYFKVINKKIVEIKISAPDDLTAIMLVVLEVLKRGVKAQEKEGEDAYEQECPVCGKQTFNFCIGEYDRDSDGRVGAKLTPDEGGCTTCGFTYAEHIGGSMDKQVQAFLEKHPELKEQEDA